MTRTINQFIIDILPLTRIPLTRNQSFSYLSDEKLPAGTLVNVPLFRRKVEGIVLGSKDDFKRVGGIELKKVEKVIEKKLLTEEQIKLAQFISDYYISPLGIVLKSFVPKRTKSRKHQVENIKYEKKEIKLTLEQKKAVDAISNFKLKIKNFLLYSPSGSGKTEVYIHSILKLREKNPDLQFLILVPEKTLTPQAMARYGAYFSSGEMVLLSSNVSKGQYWSSWQKIASGEVKIVIGTRMAVFAPFKKLGLIIIDEEQDMSYKQWDMNPRYDARTVAEKLVEMHGARIIRGSATPSVESYYKSQKKKYELLTLPQYQIPNTIRQMPDIAIVDMRKERWAKSSRQQAGNYSSISKKLKAEIEYALKYKMQVVLFINRQGMSNFSVCTSCKTVLKCPQCDRALIYDKGGQYHCVHCNYKTSITPSCSKCHGLAFQNVGLGTQKVEREINNIFPSAVTSRLDSQSIKTPHHQENVYRDFSQGKIDILIGTQMISKGWDLPKVALIGIIDTDNLFSVPDYSSSQKAYELIVQTAGRTSRPGSKMRGTVIIQTFNPENKFIKWAAEKNYALYFEHEIEGREMLNLPPFGKIIKLIFQDMSQKKAEKVTKDVYERLENLENTVSISEPQEAYISKIRGKFRRQIVIKAEGEKMPANLVKILKSLPPGWIIDVDPISIL
jgi:primosomal protein N' (replication factor Y)